MMNAGEVECLDEAMCKAVLDVFAKKAYGKNAEVIKKKVFSTNNFNFFIKIHDAEFFMLVFDESMLSSKMFSGEYPSFKVLLLNIIEILNNHSIAFVGYLPYANHLIDKTTSIEEALISLDIQSTCA